ncbi:hypothetical protein D0860_06412 [Lecanosticta acicola]|uniref:Gamma interferon inducible lysosomal thiol reductase n=1 Tax=Lecanosticta acicola TaxID=111012 RepID=A0AAI9E937_9PEZI|nr:hypothetical protein D0860_06412 [Lecanosticta acicola]
MERTPPPFFTEKQPLLTHPAETEEEEAAEPSLATLQRTASTAQRAYMRAWSRSTSGKWHRRLIFSVTGLLLLVVAFAALSTTTLLVIKNPEVEDPIPIRTSKRVPLEAHIMSKCPDAKDCLHDLILPAMQEVEELVAFRLSFIGSTSDDADDGILCKHGPAECLGNIIELCAAHLYPAPKIYLGFTMCLTREYENIPQEALVADCALEHGMDMAALNRCTVDEDGALAVEALKASFNRSAAAGVTRSCTVRLEEEIRCVRDGGAWRDCPGGAGVEDLVRDVKRLAATGTFAVS